MMRLHHFLNRLLSIKKQTFQKIPLSDIWVLGSKGKGTNTKKALPEISPNVANTAGAKKATVVGAGAGTLSSISKTPDPLDTSAPQAGAIPPLTTHSSTLKHV